MNQSRPNYKALKDKAKKAAQLLHQDLKSLRLNTPWTNVTEYIFYRHHNSIKKEQSAIIVLFITAKEADSSGNTAHADQLVAEGQNRIRNFSRMASSWQNNSQKKPNKNLIYRFFNAFEKMLDFMTMESAKIEPSLSGVALIDANLEVCGRQFSRYDNLRDLAHYYELQEDQDLDQKVERRIEEMGYETDGIADSSGLAWKVIVEKYEKINKLITQAENADRQKNLTKADEYFNAAKTTIDA